jgi:NTP pyrophosphatase (non-canonical NTP hydrolase)
MTLFEQAVKTYGAERQVRKAVEELTELSVALLHSLDGRGDTENIREEMADVEIMLEQLHVIFGYGDYRLEKEARLAERLLT